MEETNTTCIQNLAEWKGDTAQTAARAEAVKHDTQGCLCVCVILENTLVAKSSGKHSAGQHDRDLKHLGHLFKLCVFLNVLEPGDFKEETGQENLTNCFE